MWPSSNICEQLRQHRNCIQEEIKNAIVREGLLPFVPESFNFPSISTNIKIQRTIILPVVLYGCEAWSLTLRKEHRMRGFVTRALRKIFEPKMEQVTM